MILNDYINYFRNIAVQHYRIGHQVAGETGDSRPGKMRFASYNAADVISKSLRTKVGFPALLTEVYDWDTKGSTVYDVKNNFIGGFMVLDHANAKDYADEQRALNTTEGIMHEILWRIWQDHYGPDKDRCQTPFQHLDMNLSVIAVGPVFDNEFGWRVEFSFRPKLPIDFKKPIPTGIFLNLPPVTEMY